MHGSIREVEPTNIINSSNQENVQVNFTSARMTLSTPNSNMRKRASLPNALVVEKVSAARACSAEVNTPSSVKEVHESLIRMSWRTLLKGDGTPAQMPLLRFVEQYYKRLFRLFPDSRGVFKTRDTQSKSLSLLLSIMVNANEETEVEVSAKKKKLELMYKEYGMNSLLAVIAGRVLIQSLQVFLQASATFTACVRDAWIASYASIADQLLLRDKDSISQGKMFELIDQLDVGDQEWMMKVSRDEELKPDTKSKNWRYKLGALNKRIGASPGLGKKIRHSLTTASAQTSENPSSADCSGSDEDRDSPRNKDNTSSYREAKKDSKTLRRRSTQSLDGENCHSKFSLGNEQNPSSRRVSRVSSSIECDGNAIDSNRNGNGIAFRRGSSGLRLFGNQKVKGSRGSLCSASDGTLVLGIAQLKD